MIAATLWKTDLLVVREICDDNGVPIEKVLGKFLNAYLHSLSADRERSFPATGLSMSPAKWSRVPAAATHFSFSQVVQDRAALRAGYRMDQSPIAQYFQPVQPFYESTLSPAE